MIVIDPISYFNDKLTKLPNVQITKKYTVQEKYDCRTVLVSHTLAEVTSDRDRTIMVREKKCKTRDVVKTKIISKKAKLLNISEENVKDFKLNEHELVKLPTTVHRVGRVISHQGSGTFRTSFNLALQGSNTFSTTFSKTVTRSQNTTISATANARLTVALGDVSAGLTVTHSFGKSISIANSESNTESKSVTKTFNDSLTLTSPSAVQVELTMYESSIEIPFEAKIVYEGIIENNDNGYNKLSDFFTLEERTIDIAGSIFSSNCTDAIFTTRNIPIQENSLIDPSSEYNFSYFSDDIDILDNQNVQNLGDVISPPDGVYFSVLYTDRIINPDPSCGYDQLGNPKNSETLVEIRLYETYSQGHLVSSRQERVELYKNCLT